MCKPSIAQMVERKTVEGYKDKVIFRSVVRVRLLGIFFFFLFPLSLSFFK